MQRGIPTFEQALEKLLLAGEEEITKSASL
jgi:hypothetical protein